jgi:hypothetical protein
MRFSQGSYSIGFTRRDEMHQVIRTYPEERIMLEGTPLIFTISTPDDTTGYANATEVDLDTSNLDLDGNGIVETTPLLNEMIYIVGIRIINDASNVWGGLQIDGKLVLTGSVAGAGGMLEHAAGDDIFIDGFVRALGGAGTDVISTSFKDVWGVPALVCRKTIKVWAAASAAANNTDVYIRGYSASRKY